MMKKKKINFFSKAIIYIVILAVVFTVAVFGTKYYFYDSDYSVKKTDLAAISIDGIKLGMNINEVDLSKYTSVEEIINKCNYNFKELSIKTDSKGNITYIIADFKKVELDIGKELSKKISKVNSIWDNLGDNYKTEIYKPEENNYWKITRYVDTDNSIYLGIVFSRYNNEISKLILSNERIKD